MTLLYTFDTGKYKVEYLSAKTFPGALRVLRDTFFEDEPVCIGTEVNKDPKAAEELLELCADAALDGLSLVAVEVDTNEIAAVVFNKLQVSSSDSTEETFFETFVKERCSRPSSRALMQYMIDVDARCNLFEKYQTECTFEITFLGTLREHRKQKLGFNLVKLSVDLAKRLQYSPVSKVTLEDLGPKYSHVKARQVTKKVPKICHAICTVEASKSIAKKLGFKTELKTLMSEHIYNGKTYADRVGDQAAYAEVLVLDLDTQDGNFTLKDKL